MGGLLNCILRFKPFSNFKIGDVLLNGWISFRNICRNVANFFLSSQKRSRKICWSSLRVCVRSRDPEKVREIWQVREQIYIKCVHSHRKQISRWSEQISIFVIHLSWLRNLSIFLQSILIDFKLQGVFFYFELDQRGISPPKIIRWEKVRAFFTSKFNALSCYCIDIMKGSLLRSESEDTRNRLVFLLFIVFNTFPTTPLFLLHLNR